MAIIIITPLRRLLVHTLQTLYQKYKELVEPTYKRNENMDRWEGKIAVVTGASSGIGAAICKSLVEKSLVVIGLARRVDKMEELASSLEEGPGKLYPIKCDVTREDNILRVFEWIKDSFGAVHILVNNAGLMTDTSLIDGSTELWRKTFDVNVLALCICTREAVKIMKDNDIDGHIIHINSIVGHIVPPNIPFNVYAASKHAVTALTQSLTHELREAKTKIKVTSICPGYVKTEFQKGFSEEANEFLENAPHLNAEDIAEAVVYVLCTPPHVQVTDLIIRPVADIF